MAGKRHSSRRSSLSPGSPMVEYEDDGAADGASKPSKRIKTANGSAVPASPGSTAADVEPEDEEMKEANDDDESTSIRAKSTARPERRKSSRSSAKADADSAIHNNNDDDTLEIEQEGDADAGTGAEAEADGDAADAADPDATVMINNSHDHDSSSKSNGNTNGAKAGASAAARNGAADDHLETMSTISEDTDGEVPPPKKTTQTGGEDDPTSILNAVNEPQVTVCAWDGCEAGDLGTMDKLVEHLHAEHVEGKQRRYTCEWIGCPRKGKSHASAYALKAHLRSHTREKPHVCLLPECDLAFARQDALNKHMRTSHEIDMMRYYEAGQRRVPIGARTGASGSSINSSAVNGSGAASAHVTTANGKSGGPSKLKIIIKTPQSHAAGHDDSVDSSAQNGAGGSGGGGSDDTSLYHYAAPGSETTVLDKDQGFTSHELELSPKELYGVCRLQLQWAEDESEELRNECIAWEEAAHKAWLEQQVLLEQVVLSEKDWYERRKAVLASLAIEEEKRAAEEAAREAEEDAAADDDGDNDNDDVKDEDDSGADDGDDGDDVDGDDDDDDDVPSVMLDPDATQDYSFAETTSFSVIGGSSLRNEVAVNGD
ncbi:hypothetical protein SBRCBS47491_006881 [Sporothrix bragantina]|uniref:C2H2-type domain-containing protein n=1 Tax=Sporothrix bragantina TaxID=671064 RepID=A0ABP0C8Z6_9PEZI